MKLTQDYKKFYSKRQVHRHLKRAIQRLKIEIKLQVIKIVQGRIVTLINKYERIKIISMQLSNSLYSVKVISLVISVKKSICEEIKIN